MKGDLKQQLEKFINLLQDFIVIWYSFYIINLTHF